MEYEITSDKHYHQTMVDIYELMNKGEASLTESETERLAAMAVASERYEDEVMGLRPSRRPESLPEALELYMFEHKLSQAKLADELGIGKPKLSQIMTGKRKPDVPFLKALYSRLNLDPKFILDSV